MKSRLFVSFLVFFVLVSSTDLFAEGIQNKPNILFILTDDQRWDSLGCYGNQSVRTPNLDKLASQGARLDNFYVASPWCCPSRAVFLTGLYPHQTGILNNNKIAMGFRTIASMMNEAGYVTGLVGKAHLDGKPLQWGFREAPVYLRGAGSRHKNPELVINGKEQEVPGMITTIFADAAIEFLEKHKQDRWFLWFATTAPHTPFITQPEFRYDKSQLKAPPGWPVGQGFRDLQTWADYYATITMMDYEVGRVLKKLDDLNLTSNTFVFFAGDNGHMMQSHGYGTKQQWFDESSKVPAVVRWPNKIPPKSAVSSLLSSIDFVQTILDVAGGKQTIQSDGVSMLPALIKRQSIRAMLFSELQRDNSEGGGHWRMVRTDRYKYVHFVDGEEQLYDMQNDPSELCSVIRAKEFQPVVADMQRKLEAWLKATPVLKKTER